MRLNKYLADVNVLVALTDPDHIHHQIVVDWFDLHGHRDWGVCALTQAGFMRLMVHPKVGDYSVAEATEMLVRLSGSPGYRFWPMEVDWAALAGPFRERVFGHQQITDACLLGLAIKEGGVLVTMDRAIGHMAGGRYREHVLVLE